MARSPFWLSISTSKTMGCLLRGGYLPARIPAVNALFSAAFRLVGAHLTPAEQSDDLFTTIRKRNVERRERRRQRFQIATQ
jgi:hypothetical protein